MRSRYTQALRARKSRGVNAAFISTALYSNWGDKLRWRSVEIPTPGVPWLQPRHGAANIPAFFESLAALSFERFDPHTFFADGGKVFALIAIEATYVASGKQY